MFTSTLPYTYRKLIQTMGDVCWVGSDAGGHMQFRPWQLPISVLTFGAGSGIDLIATDTDGDRWAIQTKCYRDARAPEADVDSFLAKANTARFQHRMFSPATRCSQRL